MAFRSSNSKPSHYLNKAVTKDTRFQLRQDLKGFLCTCNYETNSCLNEAINLLREYSEKKDVCKSVQKQDITGIVEESTDIDSLDDKLQNLCKNDNNSNRKKFTPYATGLKNCLFVGTTIEDPCDLLYKILEDIEKTKVQKTKFLLRMLPISITCKADLSSIISASTDLFAKYFSTEPTTYAITFNHRYNNTMSRQIIIENLANKVALLGDHTVDLSGAAKLTIIVEVVKSICCMSVVRDYGRFCKFNLQSLSEPEKPKKETSDSGNGNIESTKQEVKKHEETVKGKHGDPEIIKLEVKTHEENDKVNEELKEAVTEQNEELNPVEESIVISEK